MSITTEPSLHVYYDGADYVIAHSPEDAVVVWEAFCGDGTRHESRKDADFAFEQQPDDESFTASLEEGATPRTQLMREWIAELGRTWFCSECW